MPNVLLIHPAQESVPFRTPHLGLAILAAVLKNGGHRVRTLDYALPDQRAPYPVFEDLVGEFRPDVVGLSVYSVTVSAARSLAERLKRTADVPVVVGGAHASLNPERVLAEPCVDTVVTGEAEGAILEVVENPEKYRKQIVPGQPADVATLPMPDFSSFLNHERITVYPLMTSRGCPFNCSFCCIHRIASKQWRPRPLDACFRELDEARARLPRLERVEIHDDCPTANRERFKEFLRAFLARGYGLALEVANVRADTVDDELVQLLKRAGSDALCIAVEHANPEVFSLIDKGETLEDIERAARIIKQQGMELRLCFVIGLPGDNLARTEESIRLAKRLRPSLIYWNMAHPFPGTRMRTWFEEHGGVLYLDDDSASYRCPSLWCDEPVVETPDFTRAERKQAKFLAAIETDHYDLKSAGILRVLRDAHRYGYTCRAARSILRKLLGVPCH
jgi:radical SAM superfamily enzyme YgiQ (UPF0313 family)